MNIFDINKMRTTQFTFLVLFLASVSIFHFVATASEDEQRNYLSDEKNTIDQLLSEGNDNDDVAHYQPSDIRDIDHMNITKRSECVADLSDDIIFGCVDTFTDIVDVRPILIEPLYLRTHPLVTRNVLDLPLFSLYRLDRDRASFKFDLFYNQTTEMKFDTNNTDIDVYLGVQEPNTLLALAKLEKQVREVVKDFSFNANILSLLQYVSHAKVTERRAGILMTGIVPFEKAVCEFKLPVIYQERNFDLSDSDITGLNRLKLPGGPISKNDPLTNFIRRYLLADRIGLGDLRLTAMAKIVDHEDVQYFLGAEITLPTHFAFQRGVLSCAYEQVMVNPDFDLCRILQLLQLAKNAKAQNDHDQATVYFDQATICAKDFLLGALRQLSSNVLDEPEHRSVGIAAVLKSEWEFTDWAFLRTRTILEYLTSYRAARYYVQKRNQRVFVGYDFEDESKARENIDVINTLLIRKLYPFVIKTIVRPGFQFKNTTSVNLHHGNWRLALGTDIWWRQAEKINMCCQPGRFSDSIDIEKGHIDEVYQTKAFGGITYQKETTNHILEFNFAAETSLLSEFVGDDISLLLGFELYF